MKFQSSLLGILGNDLLPVDFSSAGFFGLGVIAGFFLGAHFFLGAAFLTAGFFLGATFLAVAGDLADVGLESPSFFKTSIASTEDLLSPKYTLKTWLFSSIISFGTFLTASQSVSTTSSPKIFAVFETAA